MIIEKGRNMKHTYLTINEKECSNLAYDIFMETSGINREGRKFIKMKESAMRMRDAVKENVKIRASYTYFDDVKLVNNTAVIGDQKFICSAFDQIDPETVKGVYIYALSAGDFSLPEETIMDQLFADIWGTAFTDAARLLLKKKLEEEHKLSDSFGPGFYGMDVSCMENISRLISFEELDIELRNSRIILPLKSCAGLYFSVDDKYEALNENCLECLGTHSSCRLCGINKGDK